jgi:hypothetical protein
MRIFYSIVLAVWATAVTAQGMTVDGSSQEAYERSVKAMADSLSEADREAFARGLINLIITRYPAAQGAEGLALLQFMEPAVEAAHITLDGVPMSEILERGREIVAAEVSSEEASAEVDPAEVARACLQERVLISNAVIEKGSFSRTISLDVTNNLPWAIAGIRVNYVAMSEGRSVPWENDDFSLSISGGIEPGETRTIRTSASLFPSEAPDELITTATVLDVSDPLERQLIKDVTVIGWAEEQSPLSCE